MNPDPTFYVGKSQDLTNREIEVPGAIWNNGMAVGASNSPGIGINIGGGAVTGDPAQFTLLDQGGVARVPQVGQNIGGTAWVYRAVTDWPSSGGNAGKGTVEIETGLPSANGDGGLFVTGTANLQTLAAGWVKVAI